MSRLSDFRFWYQAEAMAYHAQEFETGRRPLIPFTVFHFAWIVAWQLALEAVCRLRGHRFTDQGFAGPDEGCIDLVCDRCGHSPGTVWLY